MKQAYALELNNALISIIMDLSYLIVIGNKKQGARFESKLGPFWTHDMSKSNLVDHVETRQPHYPNL